MHIAVIKWMLIAYLATLVKVAAQGFDCSRGCSGTSAAVCGADGLTYQNRCLAVCQGVAVAYHGQCGLLSQKQQKTSATFLEAASSGDPAGAHSPGSTLTYTAMDMQRYRNQGYRLLGMAESTSFNPHAPTLQLPVHSADAPVAAAGIDAVQHEALWRGESAAFFRTAVRWDSSGLTYQLSYDATRSAASVLSNQEARNAVAAAYAQAPSQEAPAASGFLSGGLPLERGPQPSATAADPRNRNTQEEAAASMQPAHGLVAAADDATHQALQWDAAAAAAMQPAGSAGTAPAGVAAMQPAGSAGAAPAGVAGQGGRGSSLSDLLLLSMRATNGHRRLQQHTDSMLQQHVSALGGMQRQSPQLPHNGAQPAQRLHLHRQWQQHHFVQQQQQEQEQQNSQRALQFILGRDDRKEVKGSSSSWPYSAVGQLLYTKGSCTGVMIGPESVLTSAHCVYSRQHNSWQQDMVFVPHRHRQGGKVMEPYGRVPVKHVTTYAGWTSNANTTDALRYDLAVIRLSDSSIGHRTGWLGMAWDKKPYKGRVTSAGYPGDKARGSLWLSSCNVTDFGGGDTRFLTSCDSWNGQSGSPLWERKGDKYYLRAVVSYEACSCCTPDCSCCTNHINGACKITYNHYKNIMAWK